MRAGLESEFFICLGEFVVDAVDLDGKTPGDHFEKLPLSWMEMRGRFLASGFERFQPRVMRLDLAVEVYVATRRWVVLGDFERAFEPIKCWCE